MFIHAALYVSGGTLSIRRGVYAFVCKTVIYRVMYSLSQIHKEVGTYRIGYWCVEEWPRAVYEQIYDISMMFIILIIPVTMITFAYASICRELWVVASVRASMRVIQ